MAEDLALNLGERMRAGTIINEVLYKGLIAVALARHRGDKKCKELAKSALDTSQS